MHFAACLLFYMNRIGIPIIQHAFLPVLNGNNAVGLFNSTFGQVIIVKRTEDM
jgi:hypothetical protein